MTYLWLLLITQKKISAIKYYNGRILRTSANHEERYEILPSSANQGSFQFKLNIFHCTYTKLRQIKNINWT